MSINVAHATNGIVERNGVFKAPDPRTPDPSGPPHTVDDITAIIEALPARGTFVTNLDPTHPYQIETNPAFTDLNAFLGSDYLMGQIGLDATDLARKRLGDAWYENRLIREQVLDLTGRRFLSSSVTSDTDQVRALMDNALAVREDLNLSIGIALTAEQIAALDRDIVWMETRQGNGEDVLVPVVYLGSSSLDRIATGGAVIAGKDVTVTATGDVQNAGVLVADNGLTITADTIFNTRGTMSGQDVTLAATDSILNAGGTVQGGTVSLTAVNDVISASDTVTFTSPTVTATHVGKQGAITADGDLTVVAGKNIGVFGSDMAAGGDAKLAAGNDVAISAQALELHAKTSGKGSRSYTDAVTNNEANVRVGGTLDVEAGRNVVVHGSLVKAGDDLSVTAKENISVTAAADTADYYDHSSGKGGGFGGGKKSHTTSLQTSDSVASRLDAGGDVNLSAGTSGTGDLAILGSSVHADDDVEASATGAITIASVENTRERHSSESSKGILSASASKKDNLQITQAGSSITGENVALASRTDMTISASTVQAENNLSIKSEEGDVRVTAAQDKAYARSEESKSSFGSWAHGGGLDIHRASESMNKAASETSAGSQLLAGNDLSVTAANDATVIGSQIGAGNNVSITAGRDVNLVPGREASQSEAYSKTTSSGLSWNFSENEISIGAGSKSVETRDTFAGQYNQGSVVSAGNDVTLTAQRNINQISSHVEADGDVTMTAGQDIHLGAAKDVEELDRFVRETEAGVKIAARQSVTSAARQLAELPTAMQAGKGGAAAESITAVSAAMRSIAAVQGALSASASVSATAGLSVSQSSEHTSTSTPVVSTVMAGNDVSMQADRDITIQGGQVAAGHDISLDAGRDLTVESATGGTTYDADSMYAAAGGGVKATVGANGMGAGVNAYASLGGSGSDYETTYHRNAAVVAQNDLTTKSGADTTIAGAHVEGNTVTMNVGDDLVVASRQDESEGGSHSFGVSADVMIGAGASGSLSGSVGKGESSSGWVREQTAIIGKEKVDIRVEDNTHVEGAVIAAENGNLTLDTNTLTYADIHDHDKASNINIGVSVSGSYGGGGYSTQKTWDQMLGTGDGQSTGTKNGDEKDGGDKFQGVPTSGSIDYSARDRRQINRATIGEGTIIIRANPDAGLEGLNRDLARAQEITKDSETVVSVYIDPAVVREIADGFGGIRGDLKKIAAAIKQALPDGPIAKSLDAQVKLADRLEAQGLSAQQAEEVSTKNPYAAKVVAELSALEEQYGSLENIPDAEAQKALSSLLSNPEVAIMLAGGEGTQVVVSQARGFLVRLLGVADGAGEATGATLRLVDDLCKYTLSMATGGAVFTESRDRVVAMTQNAGEAIATLVASPLESVKLVGQAYAQKVEEINNLESQGKYDEANYELGKLFFDVSSAITGLAATGKLVVNQGSKLATVLQEVKGAKAVTAKVEDLASIASLDSNVQFLEIYGEVVQRPLGRGSTGRSTPNSLPEQVALKDALLDPQSGKHLVNINTNDSRWPGEEGWIKMQKRHDDIIIHYVMNTETGAVDDFKIKRVRDDN